MVCPSIVGFGQIGERLALQAARIGHFANFRKLRVTIVESSLENATRSRSQLFFDRYQQFSTVCDCSVLTIDPGPPTAEAIAAQLATCGVGDNELLTVALCWDSHGEPTASEPELFKPLDRDDAHNLTLALGLAMDSVVLGRAPRFLVHQTRKGGFTEIFQQTAAGGGPPMQGFGTLEDTCSRDALFHETDDKIAKAIHKHYLEGLDPSEKANQAWRRLPETLRESNRQAADHIPVKLRAIGYQVGIVTEEHPPDVMSLEGHPQVELLARMEHERWCAEKRLQNYTPGPRDDAKKTHHLLVSWDRLGNQQEKDREQVRAIPKALKAAGYGIYSRS